MASAPKKNSNPKLDDAVKKCVGHSQSYSEIKRGLISDVSEEFDIPYSTLRENVFKSFSIEENGPIVQGRPPILDKETEQKLHDYIENQRQKSLTPTSHEILIQVNLNF